MEIREESHTVGEAAPKPQAAATVATVTDASTDSRHSHESHQNASKNEAVEEKPLPNKKGLFGPISQLPLTWSGALVSIVLFILTVIYALTSDLGPGVKWIHHSQSRVILLLRVLSEATGVFLTLLVASAMERLQWMLVSRKSGLSMPTILSLEAGTGVVGMLQLLCHTGYRLWTRLSSLGRLLLKLIIPVLSVIIMSQITTETDFQPVTESPVAAGIGKFRPSYAASFSTIAGVYFATDFTSFLSNSQRVMPTTPVLPPNTPCAFNSTLRRSKYCSASYFVPGGLELISPWPSKNEENWDAETYQVADLQGYQLDFGEMDSSARFDGTKDCNVFGDTDAAIQICLSNSGTEPNLLNAKFVHCPLEIASSSDCQRDTSWHASTGWTTSLRPYVRRSTTTFSRANGTMINVANAQTSPTPALINATDLMAVFSSSFNATSNSITGTSSALRFVQYLATVLTFAETSSISYNAAFGYLRNLLALPLYYFQDNNLAPGAEPSPDVPLPGLSSDLYTRARLAKVQYRLVIGRATAIIYTIVGALLILLCLVVLVAGSLRPWAGDIPDTTPFPVLDFARICQVKDSEQTLAQIAKEAGELEGKEGRRKLDIGIIIHEMPNEHEGTH